MQIHLFPVPHSAPFPLGISASFHPSVPRCPTHFQSTKLVSNPISRFASGKFFKRTNDSQTSSIDNGGLVRIRCEAVQDDGFFMRRCVEVARKAIGCTSPNPMVGCVIVKDGKIVGEGFHPKAGQPHAEVFALREAGELAEDATAYVSLEPCNHYGRTPPCSEALIKAKVKKVVVGMVDPNPIVASRGVDRLRDAGIDVTVSVEEELCKRLNEAYIHQMLTGKPFVTLRYSLSVNGCIIDQLGQGVTESGGYYSKLLQEYDAVILSHASLTENISISSSKELGAKQPFRIVVARSPGSPIQISGISTMETNEVLVFTDEETVVKPGMMQNGIEIVVLDKIDLNKILEYCKQQGFCSVLLDLRGNFGDVEDLVNQGIRENTLKKVVIEMLPLWHVSDSEKNSLDTLKGLGKRLQLQKLEPKISKHSILLEGYL